MKKLIYILETPKDLSLALILHKTSPVPLKIVITTFTASDKYGWKKPKHMSPWFSQADIEALRGEVGNSLVVCNSERELNETWENCDICISRGREFIVLKSPVRRNIALSFSRSYMDRLMDVLPYYGERLKIVLFGDRWLDKNVCGNFLSGKHDYSEIEKYRKNFYDADVYGYIYDVLESVGKVEIRKELKLPTDRKIAFLSLRMSVDDWSIHNSPNSFMKTTKRMIEEFRDRGYFIVSRRRMGQQDLSWYANSGHPEVSRFRDISHLIDMEMNGYGGFPDLIWRAIYASDVFLLSDISGIADFEALLSRRPIYMPFERKEEVMSRLNIVPTIKEMVEEGIIFNEFNDNNLATHQRNICGFIKKWYNYDMDKFWRIVMEE